MIKKTITLSLLASMSLMAAPIPNTGDILRQVEPVQLPQTPKALPSVGAGVFKAPLIVKDDMKTFVNSFTFSGNKVFSSETLLNLIKAHEGKEIGINGLKEIASLITKYYRDNGYFVARAYIPTQSMENGIVEIAIIEGTYGAFDMKNSSHVQTEEVQSFMDHLKNGQTVSTMSLERQMLLINDLSGAQVTNAEVYPGEEIGTSDFRITVSPTPKYSGYAIADNYGSRYTGEGRLSAGAYINSLSGIGDTLSFSTLFSNTANLKNGRVGYDRPLGYSGLTSGVSFSITDYTLDRIPSYDASGRADSYNAYVSYPFIKTRAHTLSAEVSYDHKEMKDSSGAVGAVEDSHRKIDALTLKLNDKSNTTLLNLPGILFASVGVTLGDLDLANDIAVRNDTGLESEGTYTKATLSANHTQVLSALFNLQTSFKAQKSFNKNLDSSEDISVGGTNGVRAYEDSELSGDKGYSLSMDLVYKLPTMAKINHNSSLFIDHAKIWKNTDIFNTEENTRTLNAVGLGYALSYNAFDLKATYAHGFGSDSTPISEAEFSTSENKFLIQGMMRF